MSELLDPPQDAVVATAARTARTAPPARHVEVVDDLAVLRGLHDELDALTRACGLPATSRGAWVRARLGTDPDASPLAVLVRDGSGALRAGVILAHGTDAEGRDAYVLAAGGQGYRAGVAALDEASARELGAAVALATDARVPWRGLPVEDAGEGDDEGTPASLVVPGQARPFHTDVNRYLSHGLRKSVRKAINRLAADGVDGRMAATGDHAEVLAAAPALEDLYRARDVEHGLPSYLDDPVGLAWWRRRADDLSAIGALELTTLHLDGQLAAYVLGLVDGRTYGVLEGRFASRWSRYSPGRLLEAQVLRRVLADPALDVLDWMTSVAPETLLATTHVEPCVVVRRPVTA